MGQLRALLRKILLGLALLLILGHLAINVVAPLPWFLIYENIVYAILYAVSAYGLLRGRAWSSPLLALVSAFEAGRVSRSIVSPTGRLGGLALQHVPLAALLIVTSILSLLAVTRPASPIKPGGGTRTVNR